MGLLQTDELYGTYLNLNIGGYPFSRLSCAFLLLAVLITAGIAAVLLLFRYSDHLTFSRTAKLFHLPFRPHGSLFRHEGYKILIAGRSLLILLTFLLLLGWSSLSRKYTPSAGEQYYQSMMLSLEGKLTAEKEARLKAEQSRYDKAFAEIERIDQMTADGKISEDAGDSMKRTMVRRTGFLSLVPEGTVSV